MPFDPPSYIYANAYPRVRDALGKLVAREHPATASQPHLFTDEKLDSIASHLSPGPYEQKGKRPVMTQMPEGPEYDWKFWTELARAGDPNYRSDQIQDPNDRKQFDEMRQGFNDIRTTWPGPTWKQKQIENHRKKKGWLRNLLNPGHLSPGAMDSLQWSRPRHLFEGLQANMQGNDLGLLRVLNMYDRGKGATTASSWDGANFAEVNGFDDWIRSNGNPLGYINNNAFGPWQRHIYDSAMERPQQWSMHLGHHPDSLASKAINMVARPLAGLLANENRNDHFANALDVYQNGNQVFRPDPKLPALENLRGMDAQNELDRYRDVMAGAMESMPVQAYHHRNTGEFMSPGAAITSMIVGDAVTDPSIFAGGLGGIPRELAEEAAFGGIMQAALYTAGGFPSREQIEDDSQNWWSRARANRIEADRILNENNPKGGLLSPLLNMSR
jgi:hypothetical protein